MIFAIRHGERGDRSRDYEKSNVELDFDPHLTEFGKLQAFHAGQVIKKTAEEAASKEMDGKQVKYMVVSSPFLRCIMTAHSIIKSLGEEKIYGGKLFLDNSITETNRDVYFDKDPADDLYVRTKKDEVSKYIDFPIQDGLLDDGEHVGGPEFPENFKEESFRQKRRELYSKILEHYTKNTKDEGNVALVIVSHWYVMEIILEHHGHDAKDVEVSYTSVTHIDLDKEDQDKVVFKLYEEHLEDAKKDYVEKKQLESFVFKKY